MLREEMKVPHNIQQAWHERCKTLPWITFPGSWQVKIIPPSTGATVRFLAKKDNKEVSIYCDYDHALGYFGVDMNVPEPYWEIYPDRYGDTSRFALNDVEALLGAIALSLDEGRRSAY